MKPKLCFVSPTIYPVLVGHSNAALWGGAEVQQSIIIKELDKRGYDTSVITMDYGQNDFVKVGKNIKIYKCNNINEGIKFVKQFHPFSTGIWKLMKQINADIYYQRVASMLSGVVAYFCKKHNKKFILSLAHDRDAKLEMTATYNKVSMTRDLLFYKYGVKNAGVIVCQNQFQLNEIKNRRGLNGIIIKSTYQSIKKTKKIAHKNILWVGKIIKWKRPEIFVKLSQSFPQHHFVLVGGAQNSDDLAKIKALASNKNIDLVGHMPYTKMDFYFDRAKLFVNTSESEGFPNTFLQAWSRGIPTISSVDPSNVIKDNKLGAVCKNFADFKKSVQSLLKNTREYQKISNNCRTYFEKNHSIKKTIDDYEHLFAKLMKNEA